MNSIFLLFVFCGVVITFIFVILKISQKAKMQNKRYLEEIELVFRKTKDIDKFISEYRELILWLNNKYSSFKEDIKNEDWIERIIKEHEEVLVDLRNVLKLEKEKYSICRYSKINEILDKHNEICEKENKNSINEFNTK